MDTHTGLSEGMMKFRLELTINRPQTEVWTLFMKSESLNKWQPTLIKTEPLSGTPGQPGTVTKLTYEENGREFSLTEKILLREESDRIDQLYENQFSENITRNTFTGENENQTLWIVENEFKFKTLIMRVLGSLMKKNFIARTQKDMDRFKMLAESG